MITVIVILCVISGFGAAFACYCISQIADVLEEMLTRLDEMEAKLDALATAKTQEEEKRGESSQSPVSGNTPQSPQG